MSFLKRVVKYSEAGVNGLPILLDLFFIFVVVESLGTFGSWLFATLAEIVSGRGALASLT
jgi:hypothetical protein